MKCFLSPNETARDFWTNKDKILFLLHQTKEEEILRLLNIFSYLPKKFRLGGDRDQILSLQIAKKKLVNKFFLLQILTQFILGFHNHHLIITIRHSAIVFVRSIIIILISIITIIITIRYSDCLKAWV